MRVLTADDQAVFRSIARAVIAATPGFHSVGQASSGEEALDAVERVRPDLVLIDVRMPGIGGVEAARQIAAAHPDTVVVLISIEGPDQIASDASLCGAAALVRKQDLARPFCAVSGTRTAPPSEPATGSNCWRSCRIRPTVELPPGLA